MATKPLQNALVEMIVGSRQKSAYTDSSGVARQTFSLKPSEYAAIQRISALSQKTGYVQGQANLTSLPPFATAKANGIDLTITAQKIVDSTFEVSPSLLTFPAEGSTKAVAVTCADNSWEIYYVDPRLSVSKLSATALSITCPANTSYSNITYDRISIRWNDPSAGWQYREVTVTQVAAEQTISTVTFQGYVFGALGEGVIPNATVTLTYGGTMFPETLGQTTTDSLGRWSIPVDYSESTWIATPGISFSLSVYATVTAVGYNTGSTEVSCRDLPAFADAVSSGVTIPGVYLTAIDPSLTTIATYPDQLLFTSAGGMKYITVNCPDSNWEIYSYTTDPNWTVAREDDTRIAVSVAANAGAASDYNFGKIYIRWYDSNAGRWVYQEPRVIRLASGKTISPITFRGTVKNASGGAGIPNATVQVIKYDSFNADATYGVARTDSSGNWSFVVEYSEATWIATSGFGYDITTIASATNYNAGSAVVNTNTIPTFANAVTNGVTMPDVLLTAK